MIPSFIFKSGQLYKRKGITVDENNLRCYDLYLDQDLEHLCLMAIQGTKKEGDINISFSNLFNIKSNFDLSLHSVWSVDRQD